MPEKNKAEKILILGNGPSFYYNEAEDYDKYDRILFCHKCDYEYKSKYVICSVDVGCRDKYEIPALLSGFPVVIGYPTAEPLRDPKMLEIYNKYMKHLKDTGKKTCGLMFAPTNFVTDSGLFCLYYAVRYYNADEIEIRGIDLTYYSDDLCFHTIFPKVDNLIAYDKFSLKIAGNGRLKNYLRLMGYKLVGDSN